MNGTLLSAQIGSIRSLVDGSLSITFTTPEISPSKAGELFGLRNKVAYIYVSEKQIESNEKKMVDNLEPEMVVKTPSLRLRNVLYRCWEQNKEGYADSESYYKAKMELIITTYKSELNP